MHTKRARSSMADPKVVREWLTKADEDYNFVKITLWEALIFEHS